MKIDLAQSRDDMATCSPMNEKDKGPYYPTAYLSGLDTDEKFSVGDKVLIQAEVTSVTKSDRKDDDEDGGSKIRLSIDVECRSLEPLGKSEGGSKASKLQDDEDAIDKGIDEASEKD